MKREVKSAISHQKIIDSASREFANKGYGLSSVNTICEKGDISKGILYHYFKDKNDIYLSCLKECFDGLTAYMKENGANGTGGVSERLDCYFSARFAYFSAHPEHQKLFSEAVIFPPSQLKEKIAGLKEEFDHLNIEILGNILSSTTLREDITRTEVIDTFRQYQDYINARYQMTGPAQIDAKEREQICRKALSILLYGVVAPDKEKR